MASLSQALRLGDLPPPHRTFQGHATHIIEWSMMLRPNDSWSTCILQGIATFLHYASRRSAGYRYTTLVVGPHDRQLGVGKVTLGLVVGGIRHRLRGFASPLLARPLAFRFRFGSALTLGVRFRLGLRLQASHGGLNLYQTILSARQLGGQFIT